MEEGRVFFDASAYMLFEASGDSSEAPYFDGAESDGAAPAEEDDAQSCSYGSVCGGGARARVADVGGDDLRCVDFEVCSVEEEDDGGGSEEEDGVVDQCRRGKAAPPAKENPVKSNGCEDSKMNEIEGDRLFWEACLAS